MCGFKDEHCSDRVVYRANLEEDPELADVIFPLCGAHALAVEEAGHVVIPLVRRMYEGGVFA